MTEEFKRRLLGFLASRIDATSLDAVAAMLEQPGDLMAGDKAMRRGRVGAAQMSQSSKDRASFAKRFPAAARIGHV